MRAWGLIAAAFLVLPVLATPGAADHDPPITQNLHGTIAAGGLGRALGATLYEEVGTDNVFLGTGERYFVDSATIRVAVDGKDPCPHRPNRLCGELSASFDINSDADADVLPAGDGALPTAWLGVRRMDGGWAYQGEPDDSGSVALGLEQGTYDIVLAGYTGALMEFGLTVTHD